MPEVKTSFLTIAFLPFSRVPNKETNSKYCVWVKKVNDSYDLHTNISASQRDFQFLDFKERKEDLTELKNARSLKIYFFCERSFYYFLAHKFRGNAKNCMTLNLPLSSIYLFKQVFLVFIPIKMKSNKIDAESYLILAISNGHLHEFISHSSH